MKLDKYNKQIHDDIIRYLSAGAYIETAAAAAGISKDTFYRWLKLGARYISGEDTNKKNAKYAKLKLDVDTAMARAEIADLAVIGRAAQEQWQAAAWRLERKYPDKYGRREKLEHSGELNTKLEIEIVDKANFFDNEN